MKENARTSKFSTTSSWCVSLPDSSLAKSRICPMMPRSASALTMALETNSLCASDNVSSSRSIELNAMIEFSGVRSSCEMFATNARCKLEMLSASLLAFSNVRSASWETLESSSASVNKPSSRRIKPSHAFMSQKFE